jgi:hypothetical protein
LGHPLPEAWEDELFHNHPAIGVAPFVETSIYNIYIWNIRGYTGDIMGI